MPYSNRYIMQQMARGRPVPQGSPEPHLHRALALLSSMDMDTAIQMGARVDIPDKQRRSSAHILLDHSLTPDGSLRADPQRFLSCLRSLVRNGADLNLPHPSTGDTAIGRMAPLAATSMGSTVRHLVARHINWQKPVGIGKESARDAWDAHTPSPPSPPDAPESTSVSPGPRVR